jgi:hypothetical protein
MSVSGLNLVPRYLPDMVCQTWNESTVTPHASGKTKSQPKTNNRKDSLPIWVKSTTTSGYCDRPPSTLRYERRCRIQHNGGNAWESNPPGACFQTPHRF